MPVPLRFTAQHTVRMFDVDLVRIHFTTYFRWADASLGAMVEQLGHPMTSLLAEGIAMPTVDAHCTFVRSASLDDRIDITSWIAETGRTSFVMTHRFERAGELLAQARLKHVWIEIGPPAVPLPLPDWLRAAVHGE
jgi:YbgC/YbaW family acyl-CoA thioester hydrolase